MCLKVLVWCDIVFESANNKSQPMLNFEINVRGGKGEKK